MASAHIHDNHGDKDEHLPPYDGTIDWAGALPVLRSIFGFVHVLKGGRKKAASQANAVPVRQA